MKYQLILAVIALSFAGVCPRAYAVKRPNVILIICDDLNDYVEGFDGHPDAVTPNIARLAKSGVRFTQAHCNIPICGPSRASLFTGIYPHHSGCYGFTKWDTYEVLKNSRTLMDHFRANGYPRTCRTSWSSTFLHGRRLHPAAHATGCAAAILRHVPARPDRPAGDSSR